MVLALYVVAGVMVAGGLLAIYSGSDIIVMERGWTMVISGSVMAASGALLAGIATAVARLQILQGEFARLSERMAGPASPAFTLPPGATTGPAPPSERRSPPPLAATPDLAGHRDLDIAPEPILGAPPVELPRAEAPPVSAHEVNEELFDQPIPEAAAPKPQPVSPVLQEASTEPEQEAAPPTVVGTYNSGGNFYIMYSDGSIEAETPAGKFRFNSLDELKDFIAAGGDKPKASTPV
jgi:hypothetical protein